MSDGCVTASGGGSEVELAVEPFEGMNIKIHNDYKFLTVNGTNLGKGVWDLPVVSSKNE